VNLSPWNVKWLKALALISVGVVAFLALRPSPYVGELPWMPDWLGHWADRNGNVRNLPAFAGLAMILVWALGWRAAGVWASLLAVSLECAQVVIAGRSFDWADIGWSLTGVILVVAPYYSVAKFREKRKSGIRPKPPG
jgi:hypothetical protein